MAKKKLLPVTVLEPFVVFALSPPVLIQYFYSLLSVRKAVFDNNCGFVVSTIFSKVTNDELMR